MGIRLHLAGLLGMVTLAAVTVAVHAQAYDPAAAEDAAIERRKILRAADQLDLLSTQGASLAQQLQELRAEVEKLRADNQNLQQQLTALEKTRAAEKQAILKEVSTIVAASPKPAPPPSRPAPSSPAKEEGFEHVVETGQSLWAIAKAYQDAGVKVGVEDIRRANNLKDNNLRAGQKLFIPKK
jgi:LysM repeat protein